MIYLYLLVAVPFIITSVIFFIKYKKANTKYNLAIGEFNRTLREGYYEGDIPLESTDVSGNVLSKHTYHYIVYVKQLDRYTNGECKIKLDRVEVTSGYHSSNYEHIKGVVKKRFCSVMPEDKIEWLESEEALKEQRRLKLESIEKLK